MRTHPHTYAHRRADRTGGHTIAKHAGGFTDLTNIGFPYGITNDPDANTGWTALGVSRGNLPKHRAAGSFFDWGPSLGEDRYEFIPRVYG